MSDPSHSPFFVHIKPREPPVFIGDKGQDVVSWLKTIEDYLELSYSEHQAIAYVILLLSGNA